MTRTARRRRLRVFAAGSSALAIGAGLVLAISFTSGEAPAAANPSRTVYVTGTGAVDSVPLANLGSGGTKTTTLGTTEGWQVSSVAVNSTASKALVALLLPGSSSAKVALIDVASNSVSPLIGVNGVVIGIAMDPTSPNNAYILERGGGIETVDISGSSPSPAPLTTAVTEATSVAISPDGRTLYVGWGNGDICGVESISIASPATPSSVYACGPRGNGGVVVDVSVAPNGKYVFGAKQGGGTGSLVFAVPLIGGVSPWTTPLPPGIPQETPLVVPTSLTVSADSRSVYVGGASNPGTNSAVQALNASDGFPSGSYTVPIATDGSGQGGVTGIALSPDGSSLVAAGFITTAPNGDQTELAYVDLSSANLPTLTAALNIGSTTGPQDVAITPDQAPRPTFTVSLGQSGHPTSFAANPLPSEFGSATSFAWRFGDGGTGSGPTPSHIYAVPGSYTVTLTETDSAGFSAFPPVVVDSPGQTPFWLADLQNSQTISVSTTPPPTTTTTTTVPGHGGHGHGTTTTTVKGQPAAGVPTLVLNPGLGPPGTIVIVTGHGFKANTSVTVSWTVSTGSVVIPVDAHGNLKPRSLFILVPDVLGPRFAQASSTPQATAPFLVVPGSSEPGGDNASLLFRSEGP